MRNIVVQATERPEPELAIEMCEHKGLGHPDTIMDAVCEAVALALVRTYERERGAPLHFNVDKGLLVGGRSEPRFGGGRIVERPKLIIAGRASVPPGVELSELVTSAAGQWLDTNLHAGASLFKLASEVKQGSANLTQVVGEVARANDTSFGVGYAPLSVLENKVLALARSARALHDDIPAAGQDFKIMGLRNGTELTFTVAIALVDRHIANSADYFAAKAAIRERLARVLEAGDRVLVNQLDASDARDESGLYLTVSGLSAEMGDDGQVGRGNRVNGLITPGRPMSLEAAAG
ncbi:MAG TPA: methionine adenosyltransferase, partial [Burkholderiales bacterium]